MAECVRYYFEYLYLYGLYDVLVCVTCYGCYSISERQRDRPEQTKEELFYEETVQKRFAQKWRAYNHQFLDEHKAIDAALLEQNKALAALKEESKELYELALEVIDQFVFLFYSFSP